MKSQVKHYRKLANGALKLVGIETVEVEAPPRSDFYRTFLARRNAHDLAEQAGFTGSSSGRQTHASK